MIEENVFWFYLGMSWVMMVAVGIIILRRNNQLFKRNMELELALADALIVAELYKLRSAETQC